MTEKSFYWADNSTGDGSLSEYDNDEFSDIWRVLFQTDRAIQSYIEGYENELLVSNPSGNIIRVATGAALVDGKFYETDANVDDTISTPSASTRIDRIVLRKSWAAQTIRVTTITGVEGAGVPSITQTDGTTWDVPLAQISITTGASITITDERQPSRTPLYDSDSTGMVKIETLVGDDSSTSLDFTSIPQIYKQLMIIGTIRLAGAVTDANVDVRFNGDSGANYNEQKMKVANATVSGESNIGETGISCGTFCGASATASHVGSFVAYIINYANSLYYKSFQIQYGNIPNNTVADFDSGYYTGTWLDAEAINQITLISGSGNFDAGTDVTLYGIL